MARNKKRFTKQALLVTTLLCLASFLVRCSPGGSGGGSPLGIGTGIKRTGHLELRIQWPEILSKGKLIPAGAQTIQVSITGEGLSTPLSSSASKAQVQNGQVTLAFSEVPTGSKAIEVKALDASGGLVAHRLSSVTVQDSQTVQVTTELGVSITDGSFKPSAFSLNKGETLLWVNAGSLNHSAKADNGLFDSGILAPGGSFSWSGTTPGSFPFKCAVHPGETGTLTVTFSAPSISSVSPTSGPTGTTLTINGSNFGAVQLSSTVTIGGVTVPVTSWSDTQIACTVPQAAGSTDGAVKVSVAGTGSNTLTFDFTYKIYVVNRNSNNVSVIRTSDNTVIKTIGVGTIAQDILITPNGNSVYVGNEATDNVSVIRTSDDTVTSTVNVGDGPQYSVMLPSGNFVYVPSANDSSVSVIRTSDNTVVATVPVGSFPSTGCAAPDGSKVYMPCGFGSHTVSVIRTSDHTAVAAVPVAPFPIYPAITPNGGNVYVPSSGSSNISVIRTSDNTVVATVAVGSDSRDALATPDGNYVYIINYGSNSVSVIRTSDNTVVATVPVGTNPYGAIMTPSGNFIYVSNWGSANVSVIRTGDNTVVATISVGTNPWFPALTPNGAYLYVPNSGSNNVSVIKTSDNSVVATVVVGTYPVRICVKP